MGWKYDYVSDKSVQLQEHTGKWEGSMGWIIPVQNNTQIYIFKL
jgi:hypothetical protein